MVFNIKGGSPGSETLFGMGLVLKYKYIVF